MNEAYVECLDVLQKFALARIRAVGRVRKERTVCKQEHDGVKAIGLPERSSNERTIWS